MKEININFKKLKKKLIFNKIEIENLKFSKKWINKPKLMMLKENFLILLKEEEQYYLEKQIILICSFNIASVKNSKKIICKHCLQVAKYVAFNFCKKCYNDKRNNFIKERNNLVIPFDFWKNV